MSLEDELLTHHMPRLSLIYRKRFGDSAGEITSPVVRRFSSAPAPPRTALQRRKGVVRNDDWLDESLGFAGSET